MDPRRLRALIEAAVAGRATVEETVRELRELPFRELEFAHVDTHRHLRTGFPEVVLGEGKTPEQIAAIVIELADQGAALDVPVFATSVSPEAATAVVARCRARGTCRSRARSWWARRRRPSAAAASSRVVSAGTADVPVAEEAALTAELAGNRVERIYDVGVAGLHRLIAHRETIGPPRSSSSWPAWRARCPAWSPGCSRAR